MLGHITVLKILIFWCKEAGELSNPALYFLTLFMIICFWRFYFVYGTNLYISMYRARYEKG